MLWKTTSCAFGWKRWWTMRTEGSMVVLTDREVLHADAEKGAILNARILWSFSAAYRVLGNPEYLKMATYAKEYFMEHFLDKEYGGVYWSVDYKGNPLNTRKQFYAIGFALYGMSEYARATGDQEALDCALQFFDCIEEHALDPVYNGYIEAKTRDWQPIADMRLSELDANFPKSQNTHLHIIEPYANLYRVGMVAKASEKGLNADGSMIHEANLDTGHVDDDLHWWVQAENVVGWMNIYQHFGDKDALEHGVRCWQYIKDNLIDWENGEWHWSRHPDGTLNTVDDKAGFWKCPYHNSRMCLEMIERPFK